VASPCRRRHSPLGLDTYGSAPELVGECSEVSYCPLTATAQLWMPIKPLNTSYSGEVTDMKVMGTGMSSCSTTSSDGGASTKNLAGGGDASLRIPCWSPQGAALHAPHLAYGAETQQQPAPQVAAPALHFLLAGGNYGSSVNQQHQCDLEAQLRAAAPEVYED
jgi:hypothetical protein